MIDDVDTENPSQPFFIEGVDVNKVLPFTFLHLIAVLVKMTFRKLPQCKAVSSIE